MNYVIRCGALLDATGAHPREDVDIEVAGDTIVGIVPRGQGSLQDAVEVDLSGMTVLPGLVDCHEHLGLTFGEDEQEQGAEPTEFYAVKSAISAEKILRAGITTVRTAGDKGNTGTVVKRAIAEGIVAGPRLFTARRLIARTGGHGWIVGREADGPWAIRAAIREEVKLGADVIKIMVSGGAASPGSDVFAPDMTDEEILAEIDEAHRLGRRIMAHGHGGPGVQVAVRAGVDSIEHGLLLTREDLDLMVEYGTTLVSTNVYGLRVVEDPPAGIPQYVIDQLKDTVLGALETLRYAATLPLRVAVGTDTLHGLLWEEMRVLSEYGFTPMEALRAGTINGAELCGAGDKLGTLEVGKTADIIAVVGDPLSDFSVLESVPFVMKAGTIHYAP
ncbi:metal-dependent hydrolase family protein [Microbacterium oxydans]|uniref:metal-dependent hydrolase family protein n=1 Tax=Microbacterium oxydans TaxID=82380 RepID=UPI000F8FAF89|nr:amidohydrolase family protein [Microbacterium oxydans]AZS48006.1 Imidazolonepropionase [Microbacterium oxydans]